MPLTNEEHLRMTLDSLFYKDRVHARLRTIGVAQLSSRFPKATGTTGEEYFSRWKRKGLPAKVRKAAKMPPTSKRAKAS